MAPSSGEMILASAPALRATRGDDLFDQYLMQDVGALVLTDLQRNREPVQE